MNIGRYVIVLSGVTAIEAAWLPQLVPQFCTFSDPLQLPPPHFDLHRGIVRCHVTCTYGEWLALVTGLPFRWGGVSTIQCDWGGVSTIQCDWGGVFTILCDWGGVFTIQCDWGGVSTILCDWGGVFTILCDWGGVFILCDWGGVSTILCDWGGVSTILCDWGGVSTIQCDWGVVFTILCDWGGVSTIQCDWGVVFTILCDWGGVSTIQCDWGGVSTIQVVCPLHCVASRSPLLATACSGCGPSSWATEISTVCSLSVAREGEGEGGEERRRGDNFCHVLLWSIGISTTGSVFSCSPPTSGYHGEELGKVSNC